MKIANTLSLVLGAVLLLISFQWIFMPAVAAETLNMIYLEGQGRNTQIRDFTAFFLATSTMCFLSFATKKYEFIFSCGLVEETPPKSIWRPIFEHFWLEKFAKTHFLSKTNLF